MVNHLVKRFILKSSTKSSRNKVTSNSFITFRSFLNQQNNSTFASDFKDIYSTENLNRCLVDLNGLPYHQSSLEARQKFFETKKADVKKAAVLIPFCYNEHKQPSVLFTLRSSNLINHKNEICFPGGKLCEIKDDGDLAKTAARETVEELGISDQAIDIIGVLRPIQTSPIAGKRKSSFVFPVLSCVDLTKENEHNIEFHNKNEDEVEEIIIRPLSELIKPENWSFTHWAKNGLTTPIYRDEVFDDKKTPRIWGLTGYFLLTVLNSLVPKHFKVQYTTLDRYKY